MPRRSARGLDDDGALAISATCAGTQFADASMFAC
jgi:hypothetical protein